MSPTDYLRIAIRLAYDNVMSQNGGPFGAIVVKDGKIIGTGRNEVTASRDPTAHAEIQAIRDACRALNDFQLHGCEIYTSCEPCPMCLGAIYWARPKAVYYACTKEEAATIGFDDALIYEQINLSPEARIIPMWQLIVSDKDAPFQAWAVAAEKTPY